MVPFHGGWGGAQWRLQGAGGGFWYRSVLDPGASHVGIFILWDPSICTLGTSVLVCTWYPHTPWITGKFSPAAYTHRQQEHECITSRLVPAVSSLTVCTNSCLLWMSWSTNWLKEGSLIPASFTVNSTCDNCLLLQSALAVVTKYHRLGVGQWWWGA